MEEVCLNKAEKYGKVEQKLEMLAQSKLQNLNQTTLRKIQDRLMSLEKQVCEEVASNQKIVREYRLMMRKYEQQWHDMEEGCNQTSRDRSVKITQLKELMSEYFSREDSESKEIYKQGPAAFEEKTERSAKELAEQIIERREETRQLQLRVQEALLMFKSNMQGQFEDLDEDVGAKIGQLRSNCELLRKDVDYKTELRRKAESGIMDHLRETVAQIKQIINLQRSEREKNRDKLCNLINNAKEMIARG